jgi:hypothetical protein
MEKYEDAEFKWGILDCCLFSADIILEKYGFDLAKDFRGKYSSEEEAYNLIYKLYNTKNLKDLVTKATRVKLSYNFNNIQLYDLVLYKGCLGVNYGARSFFLGEKGLIKVPNRACECYWSIKKICHKQQQY